MYLSRLNVDVGDGSDRPGRLWLRNAYRVHQRLCMAFPSDARKANDPDFLAPYAPEDFPEQRQVAERAKADPSVLKHVHRQRDSDSGLLFRIDSLSGGRVVMLVQSAIKPDWEYAFHNAGYLLASPPEVREFDPIFAAGQLLRFRLLANPTRRLSKDSPGANGQPINANDIGKRVPVRDDQLVDWLARKAGPWAEIDRGATVTQPGYVYVNNGRGGQGVRLRSVRYDGILCVTDPDELTTAIVRGIGSAKGFGFGLLSVAPVRGE